jgi:hypothetical protein
MLMRQEVLLRRVIILFSFPISFFCFACGAGFLVNGLCNKLNSSRAKSMPAQKKRGATSQQSL